MLPRCRLVGDDDGDEKYENSACDFANSISELEDDEIKQLPKERLIRLKLPISDGTIKIKCFDVIDLYQWIQANPSGEVYSRECVLTERQKIKIRTQAEGYLQRHNRMNEIKEAEEEDLISQYWNIKRKAVREFMSRDVANSHVSLQDLPMKLIVDAAMSYLSSFYTIQNFQNQNGTSLNELIHPEFARHLTALFYVPSQELFDGITNFVRLCGVTGLIDFLNNNIDSTQDLYMVLRSIFRQLLQAEMWEYSLICFYRFKTILFPTDFQSSKTRQHYSLIALDLKRSTSVNCELLYELIKLKNSRINNILTSYQQELANRILHVVKEIRQNNSNNFTFIGDFRKQFEMIRAAGLEDSEVTNKINNITKEVKLINKFDNYRIQQVIDFLNDVSNVDTKKRKTC